jgi:Cu(I)/Ag(I) efflux system periplasmic protein CusF
MIMQATQRLFLIATLSLLTACAPYALEPLTVNHPAHPDAASAASMPVSKTLAYTAADLPSHANLRTAAAESSAHDAHHESTAPAVKTAIGEGTVVAVVPASGQLVVQHSEIKGFMDAMTMGYPTEPSSLLEGLKPGDKVRFSIDMEKKVIIKIEKLS